MSCNLITHSLFPGSQAINRTAKIYCLSPSSCVPSFLRAHPWRLFRRLELQIFLIRPSLRPWLRYDAEMLRIFIACPRHGQTFFAPMLCRLQVCERERKTFSAQGWTLFHLHKYEFISPTHQPNWMFSWQDFATCKHKDDFTNALPFHIHIPRAYKRAPTWKAQPPELVYWLT